MVVEFLGGYAPARTPPELVRLTQWNAVVHDGHRLPELLRTAFREALSGRQPMP